jgi:hypothetical protein
MAAASGIPDLPRAIEGKRGDTKLAPIAPADLQRFQVDVGLAVAGLLESHPDKRAAVTEKRNQQEDGGDRPSVKDIKTSGG